MSLDLDLDKSINKISAEPIEQSSTTEMEMAVYENDNNSLKLFLECFEKKQNQFEKKQKQSEYTDTCDFNKYLSDLAKEKKHIKKLAQDTATVTALFSDSDAIEIFKNKSEFIEVFVEYEATLLLILKNEEILSFIIDKFDFQDARYFDVSKIKETFGIEKSLFQRYDKAVSSSNVAVEKLEDTEFLLSLKDFLRKELHFHLSLLNGKDDRKREPDATQQVASEEVAKAVDVFSFVKKIDSLVRSQFNKEELLSYKGDTKVTHKLLSQLINQYELYLRSQDFIRAVYRLREEFIAAGVQSAPKFLKVLQEHKDKVIPEYSKNIKTEKNLSDLFVSMIKENNPTKIFQNFREKKYEISTTVILEYLFYLKTNTRSIKMDISDALDSLTHKYFLQHRENLDEKMYLDEIVAGNKFLVYNQEYENNYFISIDTLLQLKQSSNLEYLCEKFDRYKESDANIVLFYVLSKNNNLTASLASQIKRALKSSYFFPYPKSQERTITEINTKLNRFSDENIENENIDLRKGLVSYYTDQKVFFDKEYFLVEYGAEYSLIDYWAKRIVIAKKISENSMNFNLFLDDCSAFLYWIELGLDNFKNDFDLQISNSSLSEYFLYVTNRLLQDKAFLFVLKELKETDRYLVGYKRVYAIKIMSIFQKFFRINYRLLSYSYVHNAMHQKLLAQMQVLEELFTPHQQLGLKIEKSPQGFGEVWPMFSYMVLKMRHKAINGCVYNKDLQKLAYKYVDDNLIYYENILRGVFDKDYYSVDPSVLYMLLANIFIISQESDIHYIKHIARIKDESLQESIDGVIKVINDEIVLYNKHTYNQFILDNIDMLENLVYEIRENRNLQEGD